jgi:hypothetical protein
VEKLEQKTVKAKKNHLKDLTDPLFEKKERKQEVTEKNI